VLVRNRVLAADSPIRLLVPVEQAPDEERA
jgi:hypothetical protein